MSINEPLINEYDYNLGIDSQIIDYIKESVEVASRVSPVKCYVLFQNATGSAVGSSASPNTISSYVETSPNYRAVIWSSGSNHPDIRPYTNSGLGSITVKINGTTATRVIEVDDLLNDNEFAVVKRYDLDPARVELVFNAGYNASAQTITYYYTGLNQGIRVERIKTGEDSTESLFGWTQYLNSSSDVFRGKNQILVRMPLTARDLVINEEGLVKLEDQKSWMIWEPEVKDFDILIITSNQTFSGEEERYEIINKENSYIQGSLITQRFKLKLIEKSDPRYKISYSIT